MKRIVTLFCTALFFLISTVAFGQTTYTWIGGNGSWAVAGNWSPTRTTPANTDILQFNDGGTYTVTAVPAQTIRQLLVTGNSNITLQSSGTTTLTINGPTLTNNLVIENGATLQTSATNVLTITMTTTASQRADISGTLNVRAGAFTTTGVGTNLFTVSATGVVNHFGGVITGSAATLNFAANSNYNYLATAGLTIPTATWDTNSNINITGITTTASITGVNGQSFGNILYNCTSQGNTVTTMGSVASTYTVKGNFTVQSTGGGTGSLTLKSLATTGTVNATVNGLFSVTGGLINACTAATTALTLNLNGGYSQSGGTFNLSTAAIGCILNIGGNFNQTAGTFTQTSATTSTVNFNLAGSRTYSAAGTITNTNLNYVVVSPAELTLNSNLTTAASRTFIINSGATLILGSGNLASAAATGGLITNSGTLILSPTSIISGSGGFTNTSAAATTISIGSQQGITATGGGTSGNIHVAGTRTFGAAANYIYTGTNGQVTGNGLPLNVTGSITVNLSDGGALTLTNTGANTISTAGTLRMINGSLSNQASFGTTNTTLEYAGIAAQTTANNEFPTTAGPVNLRINNASGVTLHAARTLPASGVFTLTNGIFTTDPANFLTISNIALAAIVGGNSTTYVNGPLARTFNAVTGIYSFPVGKSVFADFDLNVVSAPGTATVYKVEYSESAPTVGVGLGLASIGSTYWRVERISGTGSLTNATFTMFESGIGANSRIGFSPDNSSTAFLNIGGTGPAASITSIPQTIVGDSYFTIGTSGTLSGTITSYTTLTSIATALQTMVVTGNVIFELPTTYTGEPAYPVNFTAFAEDGGGPYNVTIRPETGSTNFLTAGDPGTGNPLINLNGIDRLTIDGRIGSSGTTGIWTFRNSRTATVVGPTFQFINDATFNTLTYLNVEGQNITTTSGTILFSTSAGLTLGNSNNTISFNNIRDRSDVAGVPANGISSNGTASIRNSNNLILNNNIFNFYLSAGTSIGVNILANNSAWTVEGNSFYQASSRTNNGASSVAINVLNSGIDFIIKDNYIGGTEPLCAGTPYTFTGTGAGTFIGINFNPATAATGCEIENNTIRNISWSRGTSLSAVSFIGIRNFNGNTLITNNTIGSETAVNSIVINEALATTPCTSNGIYQDAGTTTIEDNIIGGFTLAGATAAVGHNFYGVFINGGLSTIQNNTIGSTTIANSINASNNSTNSTGQFVVGIQVASTTAGTQNIIGNTIANLNNNYSSNAAGGISRGIVNTASAIGLFNIVNNTIFNISTTSGNSGTGITAANVGILHQRTLAGQTISQNTIHSLLVNTATLASHVAGIHFSGPTTGTNVVSRNNIHSLSLGTTNAASTIIGINAFAGIATFHNNMIRLGIDAAGASIATGFSIVGIQQSAAANNLYYFNTVYIGGTGVSGNSNSFAFQRTAGTTALNLRNNIFFNERATTSGTGFNYAVGLSSSSNVTCNYNIYKTDGANGRVGLIGATPYVALSDWQNTFTSNDNNSLYGPVPFINETGNAASVDLHISTVTPSQNESAGIIIATYGDFDGDIRYNEFGYAGTGTAPDIGADEGEFLAADLTPPAINYTIIPTQAILSGTTLSATISDASGVNITTGTAPRIYFKYTTNSNTFNDNTNATNGWKYVESTTGSSPFSFTIDYSLLFGGTPTGGETIEYFLVAQDLASPTNIGINNGDFAAMPSSVALTSAAFPLTGTINSYLINVLSGTVTVGTGGTYTSLTNNGGLFQAINTGALSANLTAEIISDLTAESGTHALNQISEVGAGGYTLTIQPDAGTTRIISGSYSGANATVAGLFRLDGADRVIVDGRNPNNLAANGKHLLFRNINTSATATNSTFNLLNDASNNTFRNLVIEGATAGTTNGVFRISASNGTTGNDYITITENQIRDLSSAVGVPTHSIYVVGAFNRVNDNISVTNNEIFNFHIASVTQHAGIYVGSYNTDFTITGNSIFEPTTRTTASNKYGIIIDAAIGSGGNFNVSDNFIGGNAAGAMGTWTVSATGTTDYRFVGISISTGLTGNSTVNNNTIRNFNISTGSIFQTQGGIFSGIYASNGNPTISNNNIGGTTGNITITSTSTTSFGFIYGIYHTGNGAVTITNNTIGGYSISNTTSSAGIRSLIGIRATTSSSEIVNISDNTIGGDNSIMTNSSGNTYNTTTAVINAGIYITGAQPITINNNTVSYFLYTSSGQSTSGAFQVAGIYSSGPTIAATNTITGNLVNNIISNSPYSGSGSNVGLVGIYGGGTSNGQNFSENVIHTIRNTNAGAVAVRVYGMFYTGNTGANNSVTRNFIHSLFANSSATTAEVAGLYVNAGNAQITNNMIRIGIDEAGANITRGHSFNGIHDAAGLNNYYHNSVYVGGSGVASGATATHAFFSAVTTGTRAIQNNILWNAKSNGAGTGKHFSIRIGAITGLTSSHNLLFANGTGGVLGNIGGTDNANLSAFGTANIASNPEFINETGDAASVDLHIKVPPAGTPIESAGTNIATVTIDYDGDDRASNTPTDIGADAGLFQAVDNVPPAVTYTPIANACNGSTTYAISNITITDSGVGSSVNTASGTRPRLYFKKSTDANDLTGWKFVEASNTTSPFNFTIDYSLLNAGSVSFNDQIQYFVVAQDQGPLVFTPNVAINSGSFAATPASVNLTSAAFPIGGTINSFLILPCSGVVTVGTGGNYPALTTANGVFQAINNSTLTGDLTVNIISDISIEDGTHGLNQFATPHTVTIQSDGTARTVSGTYTGAALALYRLNGADRVTFNGGTTTQRLLTFRNTNTTAQNATFLFANDASNNQLNNLIIEGGATSTPASGVVLIGSGATLGTGNDNNTIIRCDIRDLTTATSLSRNGIYAAGLSATVVNDNNTIQECNIFNFFVNGSQSSAIRLEANNSGWTIANNRMFQTAARTASSTSTEHYILYINSGTSGVGFNIDGNTIGYAAANGTGTYTLNGSGQNARLWCMFINAGTTTATTITNNTISGISFSTTSGGNITSNGGAFTGVNVAAGRVDIGSASGNGNTIGAASGNGAISVTLFSTSPATSAAIAVYPSSSIVNTYHNIIGGIDANANASSLVHNFSAIYYNSGFSTVNVSNNTITNIRCVQAAVNQNLFGIRMILPAGVFGNINDNSISELYSNGGASGAGQVIGINATSAGVYSLNRNTIFSLTNEAINSNATTAQSVVGISYSGASSGQLISDNTIYRLRHTTTTSAVSLCGIYFSGSTNAAHLVEKNFIHSLNLTSSSNTANTFGIYIDGSSGGTFSNNMIRLGIQSNAATLPNSTVITGILDNTTTANNFYYNTVYIGGNSTSAQTGNTYAFRRLVSSGADNIRNNIFANARTGGGSSIHYAFATNGTGGYTAAGFDYNIYFSNDGSLFSTNNGTSALALPKLQALQFLVLGSNTSSGVAGSLADINFVDANGDMASVNLKLNNTSVAADAAVTITTITDDREGDVRSLTTPDIGADEGPTYPIDIIAPRISNVTSVANISSACGTTATVNISATVVDAGSGVAGSPLQPQLWWRLSTGTYAAVAPVSVSGNTYNYELNLTGLAPAQVYQYYIAAQDVAGNISYSHFDATSPVHSIVTATPSPINGAPATFNVLSTVPLSGTVTVGTSGTYPRFNGSGGLFEAINTRGLSGNLQVNVISNIAELANWTPLNQWQEFCGTGYSVTISPNAATVYTVEANASAANAMFSFYGVNRLYIDGRFDGAGRYLLLRHNRVTSIYAPTVEYNNGAANNILRNCIIEGANINNSNNTTGSVGVVRIGGSMGFANGNLNNITIQDNEIRNLSNVAPSLTNVPMNLIYLGGANASANINNITITGNDLYNFQTSAIRADNGGTATNSIGNNITISNNNIYQELIIPTYQYPIVVDAVGNTTGHVISGNKIGGSSKPNPNITGTWQNNKVDGEVVAIYLNVGNATSQAAGTLIDGNTISNITLSGTGYGNFIGIRVENGRVSVNNNTIGSLASSLTAPNIIMAGNGDVFDLTANSMMAGIWTQSTEEVVIDNNIICGLSNTGGLSFFDGIAHGSNLYFNYTAYQTPGGKATITNNQILFNRSGSQLQSLVLSSEAFMGIFCWTNATNNIISGNKVRNCGSNTTIYNRNVRFHGMFVGVYGSTTAQTGIVSNNEISHLFNENPGDNASSTSRNPIIYGMSIANGNWTVSNNTIYLNNGTQGGTLFTERNTSIRGLNDGMLFNQANCQARYYNNTVYVSGANLTGAGQANSTYAFLRFPLDYGSISITAGAPIELRNNIFINDRGGLGNHRAIGNIANTNANASINWNNSTSDFNFLATTSTTTNVALWGASTTYTLANFQSLSGGGDANTAHVITTTGTSSASQVNPSELFINVGTGAANLRINTTPPNPPYPLSFVDSTGTPLILVTTDIDGEVRSTTRPDIGADEIINCQAIVVNTQPSPNNICEGSNTFFTASATGIGITYQWQVDTGSGFNNITNGGSYANAQTNQLNINITPGSFDGYEYRVVISSTCTTAVNSAAVTLTVNSLPEITVQPTNETVAAGSNTSFGITATGSGTLTYVWQLSTDGGTNWNNVSNSAPYSNVNTATLDITAATAGMNNYQYRVIVNNGCGIPDTSTVAVLTVTVLCNDNTWTGNVNTLWEVAGNWSCGIVPDTSINVIIPNVTNAPVISVSVVGGVKDIVIQTSAILTMTDNTILQVSGNFENNGTFDFSGNSTVILLGNRAQTVKSSWITGNTNSFNNLTIDKANANTVTPTDNIKVNEITMVEKGEFIIPEDVVAHSKKVELKDKLLIQGVTGGTKAGEFRVNE